MFVMNSKQSSN